MCHSHVSLGPTCVPSASPCSSDHSPAAGGSGQTPGSAASACSQHSLLCIWLPEQLPAEQKRVGKSLRRPKITGSKLVALGAPLKTYSSELLSFVGGRGILMHRHTHGHAVIFLLKISKTRCSKNQVRKNQVDTFACLYRQDGFEAGSKQILHK